MSIELKQAAQDAAEAIDWLLKNIRLDAPQLSGKAMGNAEKCASALRTAIQQAEPQPMTEDKAKELADAANFTYLGIDGNLYPSNREGEIQTDEVLAYCRAIEAHHGITAQAKKEGAG